MSIITIINLVCAVLSDFLHANVPLQREKSRRLYKYSLVDWIFIDILLFLPLTLFLLCLKKKNDDFSAYFSFHSVDTR